MSNPTRLLLRLFIPLLLLSGCGDAPPNLPSVGPTDNILAFGDSLTFGTGAQAGQSYPEVLTQLSTRRVIKSGVPGERTAEGKTRLQAVLDEHQPRIVLLCEGGNDILRRVPRKQIVTNLKEMIAMIRASGATPILLGVPAPGLFPDTASFYAEIANSEGVVIENEIITDVLKDRALKSDTIHPNSAGYRRIAERIDQLLRQGGAY